MPFDVSYKDGISIDIAKLMVIEGTRVIVMSDYMITLYFGYSSLMGEFDVLELGSYLNLHRYDPIITQMLL